MTSQTDKSSAPRAEKTPARGRARSPERTQALIDATLELLAEVGYEALTIEALVAKAHVSKSTIYRRWKDKRELVVAALGQLRATFPELEADTGSLRGDLLALIGLYRDVAASSDERIVLGLLHAAQVDPVIAEAFRANLSGDREMECARVVARGVARGELDQSASPELLYRTYTGQFMFHAWFAGEVITDEIVTSLVDDLLLPALRNAGPTSPTEKEGS